MKKVVWIVLLFCCFACEEEESDNGIIGRWVEEQAKTDTLIFESRGNLLKIKNADRQHLDYSYEIEEDSISFQWLYSSDIHRHNFNYFKVDNNTLTIENFYVDSLDRYSLLKFEKIQF